MRRSIPQNGVGGKSLSASKVCSPTVLSVSGITFLDSPPGGAGGLTPPQPTQGSFEKGKRKEEKGLIAPGKTKSDVVVAVIRVEVVAVRRTHPPRFVDPRTPAKGVFISITRLHRTLLLTPVIAPLVLRTRPLPDVAQQQGTGLASQTLWLEQLHPPNNCSISYDSIFRILS